MHGQPEQSDAQAIQDLRDSSSAGIRPVTIQQLLNATRSHSEARFQIDEIEVDRVSIIAHVARMRLYPKILIYTLEDGTGCISAKQWREDVVDEPSEDSGFYVRIIGQISSSTDERGNILNVKIMHILVNEVMHQVCFHLAEAAFLTLCYERGPPSAAALARAEPRIVSKGPQPTPGLPTTPERGAVSVPRFNHSPGSPLSPSQWHPIPDTPLSTTYRSSPGPPLSPESTSHVTQTTAPETSHCAGTTRADFPVSPTPARSYRSLKHPERAHTLAFGKSDKSSSPQQGATKSRRQSGIKRDPYANLTVLQRAIILQILDTPESEEGVDVDTIVRGVRHHKATAEQIGDALESLGDEGYIESTIDDTHFIISGKNNRYPVPA